MVNKDALFTSARTGESERDSWRTPLWLFNLLDKEFRFTLDPAATDENTLCDRYFTVDEDGLSQPWTGETSYVNPPFSQLRKWVKKGFEEAEKGNATVVMLVPARTDTQAWWNYVRYGDVRFLPGRLKFEGGKHSAPFPSAIVVFESGFMAKGRPTTFYWDIREPK